MKAFHKWVQRNGGTKKVAARLKVSERALRYWFQGKTYPRGATLFRLARITQLPLKQLTNLKR